MAPKVAIVIYSMYGHIAKMAEAVKKGVEETGGSATIYQIPETLPQEVLAKMYAPAKPDYPIMDATTLATFDAFIMGIPTRYGNFPWAVEGTLPALFLSFSFLPLFAFWDTTGGLWGSGALAGKYAGAFVSTAGPGGGQEVTIQNAISTLTHHGVCFVPFGYSAAFPQLSNLSEVHGGSPWGAGTYAATDGSRQPSALELEIATLQGKQFYGVISKVNF
ncbi:flavoprotein [Mycena sanguinolenta]|uniref:Flavoprotein n=1 Tax=Mycena sanguinolenta TaxID=230812 RepID=A0A8H7DJY6_9AGAR|nr:flavoprotein [Mycena sanguinolenta]